MWYMQIKSTTKLQMLSMRTQKKVKVYTKLPQKQKTNKTITAEILLTIKKSLRVLSLK